MNISFDHLEPFARETLLSANRCESIVSAACEVLELHGDFYECGVYKGGIAEMLARIIQLSGIPRPLHLFDSFEGLPTPEPSIDLHCKGDFADVSAEAVARRLEPYQSVFMHKGWIPDTFDGRESDLIALAHLDLDLYRSTKDALTFVWPRLVPGGIIVLDDYLRAQCPGVRLAVEEFSSASGVGCKISALEQGMISKPRAFGT